MNVYHLFDNYHRILCHRNDNLPFSGNIQFDIELINHATNRNFKVIDDFDEFLYIHEIILNDNNYEYHDYIFSSMLNFLYKYEKLVTFKEPRDKHCILKIETIKDIDLNILDPNTHRFLLYYDYINLKE